jgi:SAM-dependent methyltransferase
MKGGFGKVYHDVGVKQYYEQSGSDYANPHRYDIERLIRKKLTPGHNPYLRVEDSILDLACGSGEATVALQHLNYKNIAGVDPYTFAKYKEVTGLPCAEHTFLDILNGAMDGHHFDAIVISYALHLVKEGMMHDFCSKLTELCDKLLVIAPHKFPVMKETYGWREVEHFVLDRVHLRVFEKVKSVEEEGQE